MTRRRRGSLPPFADAFGALDKLEQHAIPRTVCAQLTPLEIVRCLWPDDVIDTLMRAFTLTHQRPEFMSAQPFVSMPHGTNGRVNFTAHAVGTGILVPKMPAVFREDAPRAEDFRVAYWRTVEEHKKFMLVRGVVGWLNAHATPGAARHYCPWLGALLPRDHPYHTARGDTFREPSGLSEMAPSMRECSVILASALLACPNGMTEHEAHPVYIGFTGGIAIPFGSGGA